MTTTEPHAVAHPADGSPPAGSPAEVLGTGRPVPVGRFRHTDGAWSWDDTVYATYGFDRGEVRPSTELMRAHVAPGTATRVAVAAEALRTGAPHATYQHLVDARLRRRTVVVVAAGDDGAGERPPAAELDGYVVDLTEAIHDEVKARMDTAVGDFQASRAVIEQAKGLLMLSLGVDGDAAFELLRRHSQLGNVRVRALAERVVAAATAPSPDGPESRVRRVLSALRD